jgi:hypothetical protein
MPSKKRTYWQAQFGCNSETSTNPVVNRASEKSSSTSLTIERGIENDPISSESGDERIEMEERKDGLQDASQVGSPQKRLAEAETDDDSTTCGGAAESDHI